MKKQIYSSISEIKAAIAAKIEAAIAARGESIATSILENFEDSEILEIVSQGDSTDVGLDGDLEFKNETVSKGPYELGIGLSLNSKFKESDFPEIFECSILPQSESLGFYVRSNDLAFLKLSNFLKLESFLKN